MADPFLAEIIMFAGNFAPRGWAFCDGQLLPINQYQALFSLLGTTFGGDGRTTFGLPELRGRVAIHPGDGPGLSSYNLGQKGGVENVTLTTAQLAPHNHNFQLSPGLGSQKTGNGNGLASQDAVDDIFNTNAPTATNTLRTETITNTGGSQNHTNIEPYNCVNYIIALQGRFPSRN